MPDCFITYAASDRVLAGKVASQLKSSGLSVFLAELCIEPGKDWTATIAENLRWSPWVIFLASRAACSSSHVQQEVGGAFFGGKTLIPVVWDMPPSDLPGWSGRSHALDLRGLSAAEVAEQVNRISIAIHASKRKGALIAAGIIGGLVLLAMTGDEDDDEDDDDL